MSVSNLATALIVIFVVFIVVITGLFIYVNWRRRSFRRHTSHPPPLPSIIRSGNQTPDFSTDDVATKELLYFFCLKSHELSPSKNTDGSSPDDQVVDVFKLLEANGPARFLCTIKEDDKDDVESTSDVDLIKKPAKKDECLPSCLQLAEEPVAVVLAEEEEVGETVDGGDGDKKTEFSTPCESPSFFTPVGSPSSDFTEFAVSVHITGNFDDR